MAQTVSVPLGELSAPPLLRALPVHRGPRRRRHAARPGGSLGTFRGRSVLGGPGCQQVLGGLASTWQLQGSGCIKGLVGSGCL